MKEFLTKALSRADLRESEVFGIAGAVTAVASTIFFERLEWSRDVTGFSTAFAITAVARDVGCRTIETISDKIAQRKEKKVPICNGSSAVGVEQ